MSRTTGGELDAFEGDDTLPNAIRPRRAERNGRAVNLRDVASAARVSVATVSMVLNNNPRISRATHARVQRVMDKMGYQPNRLAQSLSSKYTNVLAVLLPDVQRAFADAYFGEVLSGICERANKLGYKLMIEQAKPAFIRDRKHLEIFDRRYVDGVLCLGTVDDQDYLADFDPTTYPAVIVDNNPDLSRLGKLEVDHVMCDYESGAVQVMNYLLQLGHRKIGLIPGVETIATSRRVIEIFQNKLAGVGVTSDSTWIECGSYTEEGGAEAARQLLDRHPDLTAIMAGNDKMAIGAMHLLTRLGRDVPREISITGFDDLHHAAFVNPSLTTVHLPLYQVGSLATDRLIERVHGRTEAVNDVVPTHLVVRDSTGIARTAARESAEASD